MESFLKLAKVKNFHELKLFFLQQILKLKFWRCGIEITNKRLNVGKENFVNYIKAIRKL